MDQKYHWYLFCGNSALGTHNLSVGFENKDEITELVLAHVKKDLVKRAKLSFSVDDIDVGITSINYLGYMDDATFLNND